MPKPMPIAIVAADVHLSHFIWYRHRHITGDSFLGLSEVVNHVLNYKVPLFLPGDTFDSCEPDPELVRYFRQQMDRISRENISIYASQGNHDRKRINWASAVHPGVQSGGAIENLFPLAQYNACMLDFMPGDALRERLIEIGGREKVPQILFLHQAAKQALPHAAAWNLDLDWIPEGVRLVIMGDIHAQWEMQLRADCKALYVGATHPRKIVEIGPKSCLLLYDDLSYERLPLKTRYFQALEFHQPDHLIQLSNIPEKIESPLLPVIHCTVREALLPDVAGWFAKRSEDIIPIFKTYSAGGAHGLTEPERPIDGFSLSEVLSRIVNPDTESEAYQGITFLLDPGRSVSDAIAELRTTFYKEKT